jgi:septum site-determining protein MinD
MVNGKDSNIIGVVSAKGGVGKTTTTLNLGAAAVNLFKKSVLILDTNINTGNLGLNLGLTYHPVSMYGIIKDPISILHSVHKHKSGLHVIPSSLADENKKINPPSLKKKLKTLSNYDLVLLDSAPGVGEDAKIAIRAADSLLIVVTPDFPTIITALKTIELAKKYKVPINGVILNMVKNRKYEKTVKYIESSLGLPVLSVVPYDEAVPKSVAARMPSVLFEGRAPSSVSFKKLSALMLNKKIKKQSAFMRIAFALLGKTK